MIVVVGNPVLRPATPTSGPTPDGAAGRIATAAARAGSKVQLVGRVGDDADGDALVLALAEAGVGHVAVLRDAARPTLVQPEAPLPPEDAAEATVDAVTSDQPTTAAADEPATDLDAADVDLGLRYLTDFDVLVVTPDVPADTARAAAIAAGWAGATPIVAIRDGATALEDLPREAIVLEAPPTDADGAFAELVGSYAAALDNGESPDVALRGLARRMGWEPAAED